MTFLNNNIPFSIDNYSLALCDDDYLIRHFNGLSPEDQETVLTFLHYMEELKNSANDYTTDGNNTDAEFVFVDYTDDVVNTLTNHILATWSDTKTETFYKYLYIVDTFKNLENVCDLLANTNGLDVANYYTNDQKFFDLFFGNDPYRAVYATANNANYSTSDKFVKFDSNGDLESTNTIPYEDETDKIITRYFEEAEPEIAWIAKLTATHNSGYTTALTTKGSSTVEIFEEDAYDALWEDFYDAYKNINDYDNPHEKALIKHIVNSKVIDDTELPDWTIKIDIYAQ